MIKTLGKRGDSGEEKVKKKEMLIDALAATYHQTHRTVRYGVPWAP
jgi:hypothetical protein